MKTLRLLLALSFASTVFAGFARACEGKACGTEKTCSEHKDGKTCGADKDCCCSGKEGAKKEEKKS